MKKADGVANVCMALLDNSGNDGGDLENEARELHSVKVVVGLLMQPLRRPNADIEGYFVHVGPQVRENQEMRLF